MDVLGDYAAILACPPVRGLSRNSKLTYIRKDYHDRISRIVNILNVDGINISSYIDMVLTDHFKRYENQINYLNRNGCHDICCSSSTRQVSGLSRKKRGIRRNVPILQRMKAPLSGAVPSTLVHSCAGWRPDGQRRNCRRLSGVAR